MTFMVWDPSLETGITIIDQQHKGIVGFINDLHEAALTEDREKVTTVLDGLINYTISHFSFEEELLEQHDYKLINSHKKVHQAFIDRINKHRERHDKGANVARALSGELQLWLTNHIKNEDADYVSSVVIEEPKGSALTSMLKRFFG